MGSAVRRLLPEIDKKVRRVKKNSSYFLFDEGDKKIDGGEIGGLAKPQYKKEL